MLIRLFYHLRCEEILYDLLRLGGLGLCEHGVFGGVFDEGLLGLGVLVCGVGGRLLLIEEKSEQLKLHFKI